MRIAIAAVLAASLFTTNLMAAETDGPLAPGHAPGVKQADLSDNTLLWILGGAAVIAIIAVAASNSSSSTPATPVTPTSSS